MSNVISEAQELIEARLAELEPGSPRYEVLRSARDFKAAWIDLGEKLTMVLEQKLYDDWGYSTYEEYCEEELRIRKGTAYKLTRSYSFLRDNEPQILSQNTITATVPQYEVADLLRQAHESDNIDENTYEELRQQAFQPDTTKASFLRQVREADPETFKPAKPPRPNQEARKALSMARRLMAVMESIEDLSGSAMDGIKDIIVELEEKLSVKSK